MDNPLKGIPFGHKPFLILGVPPLTGIDPRSYVATLSAHGDPKTSICDVFNDPDMAVLLAAAPMLLVALRAAQCAMNDMRAAFFSENDYEHYRELQLIRQSCDDIGTLLATIPAKF
jgi:hypothetical protein